MIKPELNLLCEIEVLLGPVLEVGDSPRGKRRIIPIIGGTFRGDRFSGTVANVGADWHTVLPGSMSELDTRYCLLTHDGATVDIRNYGFRHGPEEVIAALARGEDVDPALTTCAPIVASKPAIPAMPGSITPFAWAAACAGPARCISPSMPYPDRFSCKGKSVSGEGWGLR
jgi:hypothetical protein